MGWWRGMTSGQLMGDGPLDILRDAVAQVVAEYRSEWSRKPTAAEWGALLTSVLGVKDEDLAPVEDGAVGAVRIELKPSD